MSITTIISRSRNSSVDAGRVAVSKVRLSSISCRWLGLPDVAPLTDSSLPCCRPTRTGRRRSRRWYRTSSAPIHVRRRRILGSIIHPRVSYRTGPVRAEPSAAAERHPAHRSVGRSVGRTPAFDAVIDFSRGRRAGGHAVRSQNVVSASRGRVEREFNTMLEMCSWLETCFRYRYWWRRLQ